jgi:MinD-like ATPase involved in chromosome partitioning or flagellar assembly
MPKIISLHAFRGGTGKTHLTANLAALLALEGARVGLVDADLPSPAQHILFRLDENQPRFTLNHYLAGECSLSETAVEVTSQLGAAVKRGQVFLFPSNGRPRAIAQILRNGHDVSLLNDLAQRAVREFNLDYLLIDTVPGPGTDTLLSLAIADTVGAVLRLDQQDYQGTAVMLEVARKLNVPQVGLIANRLLNALDPENARADLKTRFDCEVFGVLPHSDDLLSLASEGLFCVRFPDHPLTRDFLALAERLVA